jgi:uncharacterized protein YbjT (DUF2867 family)
MGRTLTAQLLARRHTVLSLVRPGSGPRAVRGSEPCELDVFQVDSLAKAFARSQCVVQLIGVAHPSPAKANEFRSVDLASARASIAAAKLTGIQHFVYVSVAQPAPVMKAYLAVRAEAERLLAESRLTATVLRPWYVLGPGHHWPRLLTPFYACAGLIPSLRAGARRLGLVTLQQMTDALLWAIEHPPAEAQQRIIDVPAIRQLHDGNTVGC